MSGIKGQGKGNTNAALPPQQRGRLKLDLSLSGDRRAFFEQIAREQGKEPTDENVLLVARAWCYEQIDKAIKEEVWQD